ncbi:MAG: stage III sporulation protein AB [Clostridia bacterium]|nr:stage III sporulation protein AB [Clostridia bacterium]
MNTASIFAGVCAFFSAALVGLWLKRRLLRKAAFYEEYYRYLVYASEKISYERMPVAEIMASFSKGEDSEFYRFLKGENVTVPLSEKELAEIGKYLSEIGTTDADTQIASLGAKCAELKRFSEGQCAKFKKDGALYFKLCVLLGVVAFILIV